MKRIILFMLVLLCLSAGTLFAQDVIKDSTEYKEMMRFKGLYDQAYKEGDYEKALEYAREVKKWSEQVNALADAELERRRNATNNVVDNTDNYDQIKENLTKEMADRRETLDGLNAGRIAPDEYAALNEKIDRFLALLEDPANLAEAKGLYDEIIADADALEWMVRDKTDKVRQLMADSRQAIDDAAASDAATDAPDLITAAEGAYSNGENLYNDFYYDDAIAAFEEALYNAKGASLISSRKKDIANTDALLSSSQSTIEGYSQVLVSDGSGRVSLSKAWSGKGYLAEHPLIDLPVELIPWENGKTEPELAPVSMDAESDPEAAEGETSLDTSIRLWETGVNARNAGDLEKANDYFAQSVILAETWRDEAAMAEIIYKVRKNDCLWNIAKKLYGNAFYWPIIFKANESKIKNPSLIYPGQEFVIPNP